MEKHSHKPLSHTPLTHTPEVVSTPDPVHPVHPTPELLRPLPALAPKTIEQVKVMTISNIKDELLQVGNEPTPAMVASGIRSDLTINPALAEILAEYVRRLFDRWFGSRS